MCNRPLAFPLIKVNRRPDKTKLTFGKGGSEKHAEITGTWQVS